MFQACTSFHVQIYYQLLLLYFFFLAAMVNFAQAVRDHWVHILVPLGFVVGCYLDRWNDEKLSAFRNKSVLYKRSALSCLLKIYVQLFSQIDLKKCFSVCWQNHTQEKESYQNIKGKNDQNFSKRLVKDIRSLMLSEYLALRPIFVLLAMKEVQHVITI